MKQRVNQWIDSLDFLSRDFVLPATGMFLAYIGHDALQERMFRFDGFKFGTFMTLAEVTIMLLGAMLTQHVHIPRGRKTIVTTAVMGLCIAISHGCGNTALMYSTYPLKVAFKSCKLVPTMGLGVCITRKTYSAWQYGAALVMCLGLMSLTLADVTFNTEQHTAVIGPVLLAASTIFDSVVPNLQERILTTTKARTTDLMFLSNSFMFLSTFAYTCWTGELASALSFCRAHEKTFLVLVAQATCAYIGLQCYYSVISSHGGVAVVLLANVRKIITICLSFLLFSKPFHSFHGLGLLLVFMGVYLGIAAKQRRERKEQGELKRKDSLV